MLEHMVYGIIGVLTTYLPIEQLKSVLTFIYCCFLQPLGQTNGQGSRLDKFYQAQAGEELQIRWKSVS